MEPTTLDASLTELLKIGPRLSITLQNFISSSDRSITSEVIQTALSVTNDLISLLPRLQPIVAAAASTKSSPGPVINFNYIERHLKKCTAALVKLNVLVKDLMSKPVTGFQGRTNFLQVEPSISALIERLEDERSIFKVVVALVKLPDEPTTETKSITKQPIHTPEQPQGSHAFYLWAFVVLFVGYLVFLF